MNPALATFAVSQISSDPNNFRPFPTGSTVYGTPHKKSDLDICLLLTNKEYDRVFQIVSEEQTGSFREIIAARPKRKTRSYRLGGLNLICTTNKKMFRVWKQATLDLIARRPVTRDEAVEHFTKLETEAGLR